MLLELQHPLRLAPDHQHADGLFLQKDVVERDERIEVFELDGLVVDRDEIVPLPEEGLSPLRPLRDRVESDIVSVEHRAENLDQTLLFRDEKYSRRHAVCQPPRSSICRSISFVVAGGSPSSADFSR